jgi:hypothetical protein
MLRPIKSTQSLPRTVIGSFVGATAVLANGDNAFSVTRSSQGVYVVTFRRAFTVGCAVAATCETASYVATVTLRTATGFTVTVLNDTTATDDTVNFFALGYDSVHKEIVTPQTVVCSLTRPRMIAVQVDTADTITVGGYDATVASGGTGIYVLTFAKTFGCIPVAVANATTHAYSCSAVCTRTTCTVTVSNASQAATGSIGFIVFVAGTDGIEPGTGVSKKPLCCSQLKPYIVGIYASAKSGTTITKSFGASHLTLASSGADAVTTATLTTTMGAPFCPTDVKRSLLAVGSSGAVCKNGLAITAQSTTAITLDMTNEAGAVKDDVFSAIVLGFGAATEV